MTSWNAIWHYSGGGALPFRDPGSGLFLLGDIAGHDMPPVLFSEVPLVGQQGSFMDQVRLDVREVDVPIALKQTAQGIQLIAQTMMSKLNPLQAYDTFLELVATGSGTPGRVLFCKYASGLEGVLETFDQPEAWLPATVVFRAFDPWWYDFAETTQHLVGSYTVTGDVATGSNTLTGAGFTAAMVGLGVAGTGIPGGAVIQTVNPGVSATMSSLATATNTGVTLTVASGMPVGSGFANPGDGEIPANFYVHGPIANPVFTNAVTGATLDFSNNGGLTLTNVQSMSITTGRDGRVSILRDDGTNLIPFLTAQSTAWNWLVANQGFSVNGTGTTTDTIINMIYRARHLTA